MQFQKKHRHPKKPDDADANLGVLLDKAKASLWRARRWRLEDLQTSEAFELDALRALEKARQVLIELPSRSELAEVKALLQEVVHETRTVKLLLTDGQGKA